MNSTQPQKLSDCCASSLRTHLASCSLQYKNTKTFLNRFFLLYIYK